MKLLLIRHAIAVARGAPGIPDDERPLTPRGEKRFRCAAKGLARITPRPDALFTSPLPRARRTAEIAAAAWGRTTPRDAPALASGKIAELEALLDGCAEGSRVVLVGLEPHLSQLLGYVLRVRDDARLTFRKGGAALLDLPGRLADGGSLVWYLPPKLLRALSSAR